jgi:sec-independent protein translocase protein TatC
MSTEKYMTFWEHTEELVKRLKVVLYTFIISTVAMMIFPANLFSLLNNPLSFFEFYEPLIAVVLRGIRQQVLPEGVKLIGLEISSPIELYFITSALFGVAITTPVFAYEMFKFIDPALYPHERHDIYPFLASFSILFICGLAFGYIILTPILIRATIPFFKIAGAEMVISIMDFYTTVFAVTLVTGLTFTVPIFIILLAKYGIIETGGLRKYRIYWYFAWFIITALITPDGGPIADLILFIPTIILLEAGILIARHYEKKSEIKRPQWSTKKATCKFCGETIPQNITFCPHCGKSQK